MLSERCSITGTGKVIMVLITMMVCLFPQRAWSAIGCTLSNPAEDLKYLYPEMTTFKEDLKEFTRLIDGVALFDAMKDRLGSDLDPIYETYETPYTIYSVFKDAKKIGIVHGVNVPGKGGVIQVFLSMDPVTSEIRKFFFQRLESSAASQLRSKTFRDQFEKMTLADFYKHDYYAAVDPSASADKLAQLKSPVLDDAARPDYIASLRGIRKNLILLDFFVYGRRFEPFFEKAKKALHGKNKTKG